ncbi:MAG: YdcF family protein [Bacteroidota bacterium]
MFFILSKVIGLLLNPLVWIFSMLLYGLVTKKKKRKTIFLWMSLLFGILFSNEFLASELTRKWEMPIQKEPDTLKPYDVGIVLGGGMVQSDKALKRLIFRYNTDRIFQAISLYKQKKIKKILISGGSGNLINRSWQEASLSRDYLLLIGVSDADILVDSLSKNTHENAVNCVQILKKDKAAHRFLLITSAVHMKRSMGCFDKEGLKCAPYPTNPVAGMRHFDLNHMLMPQAKALEIYDDLIHEVFGYITYKVSAYL